MCDNEFIDLCVIFFQIALATSFIHITGQATFCQLNSCEQGSLSAMTGEVVNTLYKYSYYLVELGLDSTS